MKMRQTLQYWDHRCLGYLPYDTWYGEKEVSKSENELELVIDKIIDGVLEEVIVRSMTGGEEEETV